jgi:hypothetical protein
MLLLSHLPKSADSIDHLIKNNLNLDAASILGRHQRPDIVARLARCNILCIHAKDSINYATAPQGKPKVTSFVQRSG